MNTHKHILVCCMNWGLGHATRCIPLIRNLILHHKVSLASSGLAGELLQKNFPDITYFELPDYSISYSQKAFLFGIVKQSPKILSTVRKEKKFISLIHQKEQFDVIISDSRLGCWLPKIKSIYLCHQLQIQGIPFATIANRLHQNAIKKFDEIWVPDVTSQSALSGVLSEYTSNKVKRIGWLSQFEGASFIKEPNQNKTLAIISGPEPHRTLFEKQLLEIQRFLPMTIIGGTIGNIQNENYIAFADTAQLLNEIKSADLIISRTGYTTIMDVICLGKKAILVPTPGQTEQEYLAKTNNLNGIRLINEDQLSVGLIEEMKALNCEVTTPFCGPNWNTLLADL